MLPTDIDSFAFGFDLVSANYSGGAGGTFANLVSGGDSWTANGTPSFESRQGLEGMLFNGSSDFISGPLRTLRELTVLMIFEAVGSETHYLFGGQNAADNTFGAGINAYRGQAFHPLGSSGYTATYVSGKPIVGAFSWCPKNGETAATIYDGTMRKVATIDTSLRDPALNYWVAGIGRMRTCYTTGWIARVLGFSRSLHYRDEDSLDALILTEAAKVGL